MVNRNVTKLAKKAGFIFWDNESWGPGSSEIDWSTDYSDAFQEYTEMVVRQCAHMANEPLGADILKYFGVKP